MDPSELFTCPTEKKEATPKLRMRQFLSQESKGCDYLVLWLDCDKEGENICFEVMDAVSRSIRNVYSNEVTYRAKFSAITEKDIKYAMNNLIRPNENEARSVDARQEVLYYSMIPLKDMGTRVILITYFFSRLIYVLDALLPVSKLNSSKAIMVT